MSTFFGFQDGTIALFGFGIAFFAFREGREAFEKAKAGSLTYSSYDDEQ